MKSWGKHLIVDAFRCIDASCPNTIVNFTKELVQRIDMVPFGQPKLNHFGEGNTSGYTMVQLIHTSNIILHACDHSQDIYLDVFSCKDFDEHIALGIVHKYFKPTSVKVTILDRNAEMK
jgi:S-adenosylmethionine/arginine decarboxylase-like enzyme